MVEPSPPGLRERKKAKTRGLIIDVANRMFLERGFDAVTLEQVADECEVSVRTILRYFPTKEALTLARERDLLERFTDMVGRRDRDAIAIWRQVVAGSVDLLTSRSGEYREHLVMIFESRSLFAELLSIQHAFEDVLAAAIDEDSRGTNPLGARLLACVLVGGNAATVRQWVADDISLDPNLLLEVVDYAANAFQLPDLPAARPAR